MGFPWTHLVFCVACLSMAAWTWTKFSYAWPTTPEAIWLRTRADGPHPWREEFVAIRGEALRYAKCSKPIEFGWAVRSLTEGRSKAELKVRYRRPGQVVIYFEQGKEPAFGDVGVWSGRLRYGDDGPGVDTTASRFHSGSVLGLAVGAMGCLIFGLHLRGWLRERKTLAGRPGQNMVA